MEIDKLLHVCSLSAGELLHVCSLSVGELLHVFSLSVGELLQVYSFIVGELLHVQNLIPTKMLRVLIVIYSTSMLQITPKLKGQAESKTNQKKCPPYSVDRSKSTAHGKVNRQPADGQGFPPHAA